VKIKANTGIQTVLSLTAVRALFSRKKAQRREIIPRQFQNTGESAIDWHLWILTYDIWTACCDRSLGRHAYCRQIQAWKAMKKRKVRIYAPRSFLMAVRGNIFSQERIHKLEMTDEALNRIHCSYQRYQLHNKRKGSLKDIPATGVCD
jgi:hypothetical protein